MFISAPSLSNLGQGQISSFSAFVCGDQGIKVFAVSNFKLQIILIFLNLDRSGILSPVCEHKVLDFLSFLGHKGGCSGQPTPEWEEGRRWKKAIVSCFDPLTPSGSLGVEIHSFFENYVLSTYYHVSGTVLGAIIFS